MLIRTFAQKFINDPETHRILECKAWFGIESAQNGIAQFHQFSQAMQKSRHFNRIFRGKYLFSSVEKRIFLHKMTLEFRSKYFYPKRVNMILIKNKTAWNARQTLISSKFPNRIPLNIISLFIPSLNGTLTLFQCDKIELNTKK